MVMKIEMRKVEQKDWDYDERFDRGEKWSEYNSIYGG